MIVLKDSTVTEVIQFLEQCESKYLFFLQLHI